jgi:hypothetical protein
MDAGSGIPRRASFILKIDPASIPDRVSVFESRFFHFDFADRFVIDAA